MTGPNAETGVAQLDAPQAATPQVEHVADMGDRSLERVAKIAGERGLPIRMRVGIQLWDWAQYVAWKGQTWRVEVQDKADAEATQRAMEEFFDLLGTAGAPATATLIHHAIEHVRLVAQAKEIAAAPEGEGQEPSREPANQSA